MKTTTVQSIITNAAAQILPVAQHIDSQITKQPTQEETAQ
jgi:hypothetical protein